MINLETIKPLDFEELFSLYNLQIKTNRANEISDMMNRRLIATYKDSFSISVEELTHIKVFRKIELLLIIWNNCALQGVFLDQKYRDHIITQLTELAKSLPRID